MTIFTKRRLPTCITVPKSNGVVRFSRALPSTLIAPWVKSLLASLELATNPSLTRIGKISSSKPVPVPVGANEQLPAANEQPILLVMTGRALREDQASKQQTARHTEEIFTSVKCGGSKNPRLITLVYSPFSILIRERGVAVVFTSHEQTGGCEADVA